MDKLRTNCTLEIGIFFHNGKSMYLSHTHMIRYLSWYGPSGHPTIMACHSTSQGIFHTSP